jgi:hypothetical protein
MCHPHWTCGRQNATVRDVEVAAVDLRLFDQLFTAQEVLQ